MVKVKQQFFKTAGGAENDNGTSLSVNCKRVFVTGQVSGSMTYDFSGTPHQLNGGNDIFVAGLDHCGTQKFFKTAGGLGDAGSISITSNDCCTFLTGFLQGDTASDFNGKEFDVTGGNDIYVAGIDNCGNQKFFVTAGGNGDDGQDDSSFQIVNDNKCLYITGYVTGTGAYDFNGVLRQLKGENDIFVAGLDHCGNQKFFTTAGGINDDNGKSITVNKKGVFVIGNIQSPSVTTFKNEIISTYGTQDIFVAGLNKCGYEIFFKHAGGLSVFSSGQAIASDCDHIYVTGVISGQTATNFNGTPVNNIAGADIFVSGLDTCGKQTFFVTAGSSAINEGLSIATNDHGVFVTGYVQGPNATDFKHKPVTTYGSTDIFVAGLTKCGTQKFFVTAGSSGAENGISITANDAGIFVTGFIAGPTATDFCGKPVNNLQGDGDIFVAKLDFCGRQKFFITAGGNQFDQGNQIVVRGNEIYVTGSMGGTAGVNFKHCPVTTLKGGTDIFVARLDDLCHKKCSAKK